MMDPQIVVGLITGGAAIFTSLLIVGVQIIFHTKSFEEEYSNKVAKIKLKLKTTIDGQILTIVNRVLEELVKVKEKQGAEKISDLNISEEIINEIIEVHALDTLIEVTGSHNQWCNFIVRCKELIRRIGAAVILSGLTVLISFIFVIVLNSYDSIPFMFMILFFIAFFLFGFIAEFRKCLMDVDSTYEKLESGLEL